MGSRIDLSNTTTDELDTLYRACKPAEFGRGGENVLDKSYRRAGKMDLESFSTLFDPHSLGIHGQVSKALLTDGNGMMDLELYKLNVYGKGDFFKAHKDTPRDKDMFGSLVVVLPTPHEGGQLVLRQDGKEWTIDFTDNFANAKVPSACYVAFYSDIEHEVLPVTSGYRVTFTYNLYRLPFEITASPIPTPQHLNLKQALVDLINDKNTLPKGGYLGFGLVHEYVHTGRNVLDPLLDQLKGSDRALADVCDALNLPYTLRLLYRGMLKWYEGLHLITTEELDAPEGHSMYEDSSSIQQLEQTLKDSELTIEQAEVVELVGNANAFDPVILDPEEETSLSQFCKNPPTQVMEITRMKSSVDYTSAFMAYGNEAEFGHFYGTACMLVAVEPATSRKPLAV
ncbi:hypothetical protein JVU11DRAFT_3059 [Chiua virens]|nr:hypothetical protein JVU11DRAFT_3059 [Chiua virens]